MEIVLLILISVILGAFGQIFLKKGMKNVGEIEIKDLLSSKFFNLIREKFLFLGIALYGLAAIVWLVILSKAELSFAYPLISIGYILVAVLSKIFLNESLTLVRFLGIILIFIGVFLILRS